MLTVNQLTGFGASVLESSVVLVDFDEFSGSYAQLPNVADDFWASGWVWRPLYAAIQGLDSFDSYDEGVGVDTDLNLGIGMNDHWVHRHAWREMLGYDDMSDYPDGISSNGSLNSGNPNGFSTGWIEIDNA